MIVLLSQEQEIGAPVARGTAVVRKPFDPVELMRRLMALISARRGRNRTGSTNVHVGPLRLDPERHEVRMADGFPLAADRL